jgi:hypothetical protein
MPPERNGPGALAGATEAGIGYAKQQSDTANRAPGQPADPVLGIRLRGFRLVPKGALIGYAVELPSALLVHDCPIFHAKDGSAWAALPATPVTGRHGRRQFAPMVEWRSPELGNRFSAAVIALIDQACPGALGGAAP